MSFRASASVARSLGIGRRGHKYGAQRVEIAGERFDSKAEADRYTALRWMVKAGIITDLERQPAFDLVVAGLKVGRYVGDFRYRVVATGEVVVEDVKGVRTAVYRLKKKLVLALYGVAIAEVDVKDVHTKAVPVTAPIRRRRR